MTFSDSSGNGMTTFVPDDTDCLDTAIGAEGDNEELEHTLHGNDLGLTLSRTLKVLVKIFIELGNK